MYSSAPSRRPRSWLSRSARAVRKTKLLPNRPASTRRSRSSRSKPLTPACGRREGPGPARTRRMPHALTARPLPPSARSPPRPDPPRATCGAGRRPRRRGCDARATSRRACLRLRRLVRRAGAARQGEREAAPLALGRRHLDAPGMALDDPRSGLQDYRTGTPTLLWKFFLASSSRLTATAGCLRLLRRRFVRF